MTRAARAPRRRSALPLALLAFWQAWARRRRSAHAHAAQGRRRGDRHDRERRPARRRAASLGRVFGGFAVAALIGVPLGLAMGTVARVERNVDPLVESFRPIAAIAILPLAILWLGTGTAAAVAIVAYAAFFPIVVTPWPA
jgi:ABC-type nitrate/sulfonate/bicarbonate transport system permease component